MSNKQELAKIAREIKSIKSSLNKFAGYNPEDIAKDVAQELGFGKGKKSRYGIVFEKTIQNAVPNWNQESDDEPESFPYEIYVTMSVEFDRVTIEMGVDFDSITLRENDYIEKFYDRYNSNVSSTVKGLHSLIDQMEKEIQNYAEEYFLE